MKSGVSTRLHFEADAHYSIRGEPQGVCNALQELLP
jgi:hypothetical protein